MPLSSLPQLKAVSSHQPECCKTTCSGRPPVAAAAPSDPVTAKFNIAGIAGINTLTKFFTGLIIEAYASSHQAILTEY